MLRASGWTSEPCAGSGARNWSASTRVAALGALLFAGSLAGTLLAAYHNDPGESVAVGIYGYNAALAAVAVYLWRKSLLNPVLAALVSVPLTELFPGWLGLPALTAPFVVASWIVLAIGWLETSFCAD